MSKLKIVCLDAATLGNADLSAFREFGDFVSYDLTPKDKVIERLKDADVAMVNKVVLDEAVLNATNLKLILETATGTNNITVDFIKARVYNQKNKAVSADEDYKFCCF